MNEGNPKPKCLEGQKIFDHDYCFPCVQIGPRSKATGKKKLLDKSISKNQSLGNDGNSQKNKQGKRSSHKSSFTVPTESNDCHLPVELTEKRIFILPKEDNVTKLKIELNLNNIPVGNYVFSNSVSTEKNVGIATNNDYQKYQNYTMTTMPSIVDIPKMTPCPFQQNKIKIPFFTENRNSADTTNVHSGLLSCIAPSSMVANHCNYPLLNSPENISTVKRSRKNAFTFNDGKKTTTSAKMCSLLSEDLNENKCIMEENTFNKMNSNPSICSTNSHNNANAYDTLGRRKNTQIGYLGEELPFGEAIDIPSRLIIAPGNIRDELNRVPQQFSYAKRENTFHPFDANNLYSTVTSKFSPGSFTETSKQLSIFCGTNTYETSDENYYEQFEGSTKSTFEYGDANLSNSVTLPNDCSIAMCFPPQNSYFRSGYSSHGVNTATSSLIMNSQNLPISSTQCSTEKNCATDINATAGSDSVNANMNTSDELGTLKSCTPNSELVEFSREKCTIDEVSDSCLKCNTSYNSLTTVSQNFKQTLNLKRESSVDYDSSGFSTSITKSLMWPMNTTESTYITDENALKDRNNISLESMLSQEVYEEIQVIGILAITDLDEKPNLILNRCLNGTKKHLLSSYGCSEEIRNLALHYRLLKKAKVLLDLYGSFSNISDCFLGEGEMLNVKKEDNTDESVADENLMPSFTSLKQPDETFQNINDSSINKTAAEPIEGDKRKNSPIYTSSEVDISNSCMSHFSKSVALSDDLYSHLNNSRVRNFEESLEECDFEERPSVSSGIKVDEFKKQQNSSSTDHSESSVNLTSDESFPIFNSRTPNHQDDIRNSIPVVSDENISSIGETVSQCKYLYGSFSVISDCFRGEGELLNVKKEDNTDELVTDENLIPSFTSSKHLDESFQNINDSSINKTAADSIEGDQTKNSLIFTSSEVDTSNSCMSHFLKSVALSDDLYSHLNNSRVRNFEESLEECDFEERPSVSSGIKVDEFKKQQNSYSTDHSESSVNLASEESFPIFNSRIPNHQNDIRNSIPVVYDENTSSISETVSQCKYNTDNCAENLSSSKYKRKKNDLWKINRTHNYNIKTKNALIPLSGKIIPGLLPLVKKLNPVVSATCSSKSTKISDPLVLNHQNHGESRNKTITFNNHGLSLGSQRKKKKRLDVHQNYESLPESGRMRKMHPVLVSNPHSKGDNASKREISLKKCLFEQNVDSHTMDKEIRRPAKKRKHNFICDLKSQDKIRKKRALQNAEVPKTNNESTKWSKDPLIQKLGDKKDYPRKRNTRIHKRDTVILKNFLCLECGRLVDLHHFWKRFNCNACKTSKFSTNCPISFSQHRGQMLFGVQKSRLGKAYFWCNYQVDLKQSWRCLCGFITNEGNELASHLVKCRKSTCFCL